MSELEVANLGYELRNSSYQDFVNYVNTLSNVTPTMLFWAMKMQQKTSHRYDERERRKIYRDKLEYLLRKYTNDTDIINFYLAIYDHDRVAVINYLNEFGSNDYFLAILLAISNNLERQLIVDMISLDTSPKNYAELILADLENNKIVYKTLIDYNKGPVSNTVMIELAKMNDYQSFSKLLPKIDVKITKPNSSPYVLNTIEEYLNDNDVFKIMVSFVEHNNITAVAELSRDFKGMPIRYDLLLSIAVRKNFTELAIMIIDALGNRDYITKMEWAVRNNNWRLYNYLDRFNTGNFYVGLIMTMLHKSVFDKILDLIRRNSNLEASQYSLIIGTLIGKDQEQLADQVIQISQGNIDYNELIDDLIMSRKVEQAKYFVNYMKENNLDMDVDEWRKTAELYKVDIVI